MSSKNSSAVEVEIFGSSYPVRGDQDEEQLQDLAATVDAKMREIAQNVATVDRAKIAILAALNLAAELEQTRGLQEGEKKEIRERVVALAGDLREALEE